MAKRGLWRSCSLKSWNFRDKKRQMSLWFFKMMKCFWIWRDCEPKWNVTMRDFWENGLSDIWLVYVMELNGDMWIQIFERILRIHISFHLAQMFQIILRILINHLTLFDKTWSALVFTQIFQFGYFPRSPLLSIFRNSWTNSWHKDEILNHKIWMGSRTVLREGGFEGEMRRARSTHIHQIQSSQ